VTQAQARERLLAITLAKLGRLDVLVNNAGSQRLGFPDEVTEEHWDTVMDVNAKGVYFCCQTVLRQMSAQKSGCIINIASAAGKLASTTYHPVYNISKAAVLALTKTLAHAYAAQGIRINAVCPGIIATPMQDMVDQGAAGLLGKEAGTIHAERLAKVPLGRAGEPEEVAAVVSFLVGPDSRYMTGQALNVTGGMVMS
jgi:NAD(P)-dependent dehydrogenase (short-subunit alcohol dehydrogenase family)